VITLQANVVIGGNSYEGLIGNVSEEGISSTITAYITTDKNFVHHKAITLNFKLSSGDPAHLTCEIRWFLKPQEKGKSLILGLYIVDPPPKYTEWIEKFR